MERGTNPEFKDCIKHHVPSPWPDYECEDCKTDIYVQEAKRQEIERRGNWLLNLNLPPRVFDPFKTFPSNHPSRELDKTWKEIASEYGAVILSGRMGTGKSAWACSKIAELGGGKPIFRSMIGMIQDIRATWNNAGKSEATVLKNFCECNLLVIDDFGVQGGTENERNLTYAILTERYNYFRPTIITTNLNFKTPEGKAQVIQCLGNQIYDRFNGGFYSCEDWPRIRGVEKVGFVQPIPPARKVEVSL